MIILAKSKPKENITCFFSSQYVVTVITIEDLFL